MAVVLICSNRSLDGDLKGTLLFRSDVQREQVRSTTEAQARLSAGGIALFCIHREVRGVEVLIKALRRSAALKRMSIVVFSEDDFDPSEVEVLEAGANAILRLPPADDFDQRLGQLIEVPTRKDVRLPVRLQVTASSGFGATVPVLAQNLSRTGILIESNHELNMGDEVSIALRFQESGALFTATAHITRTAGPNRYGARFKTITKGEEALKDFLAATSLA
ncbi:MAG: PilZ domain-containing protein [Vicinamibacteria bacterium]|nr:PilZ domain-containing protein [Vicinamibacteria bacterium]